MTTNQPPPVLLNPSIAKPERIYKAMSRKEIADKYGVSTKTFRRWCERIGMKLPNGLLTPNQVKLIVEAFGDWEDNPKA